MIHAEAANIHIPLCLNVLIDLERIEDCLRGATLSYYSNFVKTFVNALSYKCLHLDFLELNHQTFKVLCVFATVGSQMVVVKFISLMAPTL